MKKAVKKAKKAVVSSKNFKENKNDSVISPKQNKLRFVLVSALVLVLFLSLFVFFSLLSYKNSILEIRNYDAAINVSDYVGFNLNPDKLYFGTASPGGSATREINLTSNKGEYVYVTADHDVKDWIYVSTQNGYIPGGNQILKIKMKVPSSAHPGEYSFKIRILVSDKKANFVSSLFFGRNAVRLDELEDSSGSGKVQIEIINSSSNK